jgi:hypothetical protein
LESKRRIVIALRRMSLALLTVVIIAAVRGVDVRDLPETNARYSRSSAVGPYMHGTGMSFSRR